MVTRPVMPPAPRVVAPGPVLVATRGPVEQLVRNEDLLILLVIERG